MSESGHIRKSQAKPTTLNGAGEKQQSLKLDVYGIRTDNGVNIRLNFPMDYGNIYLEIPRWQVVNHLRRLC